VAAPAFYFMVWRCLLLLGGLMHHHLCSPNEGRSVTAATTITDANFTRNLAASHGGAIGIKHLDVLLSASSPCFVSSSSSAVLRGEGTKR